MTDKTQVIRLVDMFLLGPFMLYFAYQAKNVTTIEKEILALAGWLTIIYNGSNYFETRANS